jgi:hypothetical protein
MELSNMERDYLNTTFAERLKENVQLEKELLSDIDKISYNLGEIFTANNLKPLNALVCKNIKDLNNRIVRMIEYAEEMQAFNNLLRLSNDFEGSAQQIAGKSEV